MLREQMAGFGWLTPRILAHLFLLTSVLYLGLATVIIGALGDHAGSTVALAELLHRASIRCGPGPRPVPRSC